MFSEKVMKSLVGGIAAAVLAVGASVVSTPVLADPVPTPDGYNGYLVYIANGIFSPTDNGALFGEDAITVFHKGIMRRTDAEVEANRQAAIAFYAHRFGLMVENNPDLFFSAFFAGSRINYRAYTVAGMKVPSAGWPVRDGGWLVSVLNPNGITLGGNSPACTCRLEPPSRSATIIL